MKHAKQADEPCHPIQLVSRRTGVSPDALRVWERRHGAVRPERTPGGQRLYTDADVARLRMLRRLTEGGRRIGQLANLELAQLEELARADAVAEQEPDRSEASPAVEPLPELAECLAAARSLDGAALESVLNRASVALDVSRLLHGVVLPVLRLAGEQWRSGDLRPPHEHLLTVKVRGLLTRLLAAQQAPAGAPPAPEVLVTTPSGEHHELSALAAAVLAAAARWNVTFLGPDMPADDIASAARQRGARAIVLAVVHPDDPKHAGAEIRRLGDQLPPDTQLLVGGPSSGLVGDAVRASGGRLLPDLDALGRALDELGREGGWS